MTSRDDPPMPPEDHLLTEARNPQSEGIDRLDAGGIVALMNGEDAKVVAAVGAVSAKDLVVGIATSGRTPYVLGAIARAKPLGAFTVGIACNRPSLLGAAVDLEIAPLVGPEVIAGSTRLKAGTATKMILNMITT